MPVDPLAPTPRPAPPEVVPLPLKERTHRLAHQGYGEGDTVLIVEHNGHQPVVDITVGNARRRFFLDHSGRVTHMRRLEPGD